MVEPRLAIIHGIQTIHNPRITQTENHGSKLSYLGTSLVVGRTVRLPLFFIRVNPNYTYHLPIKGQVRNLSPNTQMSTYSNHLNSNSFMPFLASKLITSEERYYVMMTSFQ